MIPELKEIAIRRRQLGLTQKELAEKAQVNRSLLAKIEKGYANPSFKSAKRIFDTLEKLEAINLVGLDWVKVGDIHNEEIIWAEYDGPLYEAQRRMAEGCFSQLPVKQGERECGSVTEKGISRAILAGKDLGQLKVKDILEQSFPHVAVDTPVHLIIPVLQAKQAVLTVENGKIKGIVTNSDIGKVFDLKAVKNQGKNITF